MQYQPVSFRNYSENRFNGNENNLKVKLWEEYPHKKNLAAYDGFNIKFQKSINVAFPGMCHRYAAHFRHFVSLLPYFQCYAPRK